MSLQTALQQIKKAYPVKNTDEHTAILAQMAEEISIRTDNFKNPDSISTEKIDLKAVLRKEGISPGEWKKEKGDFARSEADTVMWLANMLANGAPIKKTGSGSGADADAEKAKRIRIAKVKAAAKLKMLKLLEV